MIDKINFRFKDKVFIFLAIVGLLLAFYFRLFSSNNRQIEPTWSLLSEIEEKVTDSSLVELAIGKEILEVEIAKNNEKMILGLGQREKMIENHGMLFIFPRSDRHPFEMRGMRFDLDFIFINDSKIVEIIKNVPVNFSGILSGDKDYNKVLEVNAGWTDEKGIAVGDKVMARIK